MRDLDDTIHGPHVVGYASGAFLVWTVAARLAAPRTVDDELELVLAGFQLDGKRPGATRRELHRQRSCFPVIERAGQKDLPGLWSADLESMEAHVGFLVDQGFLLEKVDCHL